MILKKIKIDGYKFVETWGILQGVFRDYLQEATYIYELVADEDELGEPDKDDVTSDDKHEEKLPQTGVASILALYSSGFMNLLGGVYLSIRNKFRK